jgi:hypothetical protein
MIELIMYISIPRIPAKYDHTFVKKYNFDLLHTKARGELTFGFGSSAGKFGLKTLPHSSLGPGSTNENTIPVSR